MRAFAVVFLLLVTGCTSSANEDFASTTPSVTQQAVDDVGIVITRPDWPSLVTDMLAPPPRDALPLSEKPVRRASLAVTDLEGDRGIYVLGRNGEWRRVDAPHLSYEFEGPGQVYPTLSTDSIDASGTRLAVPQDESLVVIDLTTGTFRRYDVPGQNDHVAWEGPDDILVGHDTRLGGTLVDLQTGELSESTHRRTTRVLPDGSALTWGGGRGNDNYYFNVMKWDDGHRVFSPANNAMGYAPVVQGDVVVATTRAAAAVVEGEKTGQAELDDLMWSNNGVSAVDAVTGRVLGWLQLSDQKFEWSKPLGWIGGLPVLQLVKWDETQRRSNVVAWNYETGELIPLATLPTWYVAWGTGL